MGVDWNSRNETIKNTKRISLTIIIAIIAIVALVAGAITLSVTNTATVTPGATALATGPETATTACSGSTGTYSSTVGLTWTVTQGVPATQYICLENSGTGSYTLAFTTNLPASDGTVSSSKSGSIIPAGGFLLVDLNWAVSQTASGTIAFTITFQ